MDPKSEFTSFVQTLKSQGFLGDHFDNILQIQKETGNSRFILELLSTFYKSVDSGIEEINKELNVSCSDYSKLRITGIRITGSATSIGGVKLEVACRRFVDAIDRKASKTRCFSELENMRSEYINLHANLDILAHILGKFPDHSRDRERK